MGTIKTLTNNIDRNRKIIRKLTIQQQTIHWQTIKQLNNQYIYKQYIYKRSQGIWIRQRAFSSTSRLKDKNHGGGAEPRSTAGGVWLEREKLERILKIRERTIRIRENSVIL